MNPSKEKDIVEELNEYLEFFKSKQLNDTEAHLKNTMEEARDKIIELRKKLLSK